MPVHASYKHDMHKLDIAFIDDNKGIHKILKSVLNGFGISRLRTFERPDVALKHMQQDPPDLVITDWRMAPFDGCQLIKIMRHKDMGGLCLVPAIILTGHASRSFVDKALRSGAQQFLVKPISPEILYRRLKWVLKDDRHLVLKGDRYVIEGVEQLLTRGQSQFNRSPLENEAKSLSSGAPKGAINDNELAKGPQAKKTQSPKAESGSSSDQLWEI